MPHFVAVTAAGRPGRWALVAAVGFVLIVTRGLAEEPPVRTQASVLGATTADDWRTVDPSRMVVMNLDQGRVVIELIPEFAPRHVDNLRALIGEKYFDGLAILRSQDNYVAQWGDPQIDSAQARPFGKAKERVPAELARPIEGTPPFHALLDGDVYAPEVGLSLGFPVARDPEKGLTWLVHCYGMVGVGRSAEHDSGNAAQLYVVTGHSPRHLDRNVTLIGRVLEGMELLTPLPRGTGRLGFYEDPAPRPPVHSMRFASELPEDERPRFEVLKTDTETFAEWVEARRTRREEWFLDPVGRLGICNAAVPTRRVSSATQKEVDPRE